MDYGLCDKNLFTELKNLKRFPRYDFAKTGRTGPFSAICLYGISCLQMGSKWALGKFFLPKMD